LPKLEKELIDWKNRACKHSSKKEVSAEEIAEIVSKWTGFAEPLIESEKEKTLPSAMSYINRVMAA